MTQLLCNQCGKTHSTPTTLWKCTCGGILDLEFRSSFPVEKIQKRKPAPWRYKEAIPIENKKHTVSLGEGLTPLVSMNFSGKTVYIKQDQQFPTGSFKDRGASVLISKARELGVKKVVVDSSGNAGSAIAAYCANANISCDVYVPENTVLGKTAQIRSYGAKLHKIPGTREDTANAAFLAAKEHYYASHYWNPYFIHGLKTFAFEICEQLGWSAPDTVILPVGQGTLLLGAALGFKELLQARIIHSIPKLIGVQAENCAPLCHAFHKSTGRINTFNKKSTIAAGIAISNPLRGKQILDAVQKTNGEFITVTEKEIKRALQETRHRGYYIEPTSASAIAGLKKYISKSDPGEVIVSIFTGHGLKATEKITSTG